MATFFLNTGKTLAYYSFVELSCLVRTHLAPVYLVAALLKHCTYIALFCRIMSLMKTVYAPLFCKKLKRNAAEKKQWLFSQTE